MEFYCNFCDEFLTYQVCPYCNRPCTDVTSSQEYGEDPDLGDELDVEGLVDDGELDFDREEDYE